MDADSFSSEMMDNIQNIDVFIAGSEFFYNALFRDRTTREELRGLCERGPSIVVFTLGVRGAWATARRREYFGCPPLTCRWRTPWAPGTCSTGPMWQMRLLQRLSPKEAARLATGVSCIKCTRIGAGRASRTGTPCRKYLQTGEIDYTEIDQRVEILRGGNCS